MRVAELIVSAAYADEEANVSGSASMGAVPVTDVSQFTGAASIKIPIQVPAGRANMAPNLALTYNSYQGNGWIGVGFSLEMGSIQRSNKHGLDYTAVGDGAFVASIGGSSADLVRRTDWDQYCPTGYTAYGTKIDNSLSRYCYDNNSKVWEVTSRDGTRYYYGSTEASRQDFLQSRVTRSSNGASTRLSM